MNDTIPERASELAALPTKGRVLPFEKPQSPLQRAVQLRAQEHIERQLAKPKVEPARVIATLAVAALPVLLLIGALNAVLRVLHDYMNMKPDTPAVQVQPAAVQPQQPGVVFVVPSGASADKPAPPAPQER